MSACRQPRTTNAAARDQVHPTYDKSGVLTKLEGDSDHDGKTDTWAYMDGARVVRVEVDENGDGTVDRWEYHRQTQEGQRAEGGGQRAEGGGQRAEGNGERREGQDGTARPIAQAAPLRRVGRGGLESPDKTIERIERATRHDGVVSRWEYFDHGLLTRIEQDTDGDGNLDKWETYSGGSLSMMAIDTQHRGRPDRRLVYRPDGTLDRIESDPTGSGTFHPLPIQPAK